MKRTGASLTAIAFLALGAIQPALAVEQVSKHFSIMLKSQEQRVSRFDCESGRLLSGGYSLSLVATSSGVGAVPPEKLIVHSNVPASDAKGWVVGLTNSSDIEMVVRFNIHILCD